MEHKPAINGLEYSSREEMKAESYKDCPLCATIELEERVKAHLKEVRYMIRFMISTNAIVYDLASIECELRAIESQLWEMI